MDIIQNLLSEGFIDRTRARARGNVWYYEINSEFISKDEILHSLKTVCGQCSSLIKIKHSLEEFLLQVKKKFYHNPIKFLVIANKAAS